MDKSLVKGVVIGGIATVVVTGGAVTGYRTMTQPKAAEVVAVKEVMHTVSTPRQASDTGECSTNRCCQTRSACCVLESDQNFSYGRRR